MPTNLLRSTEDGHVTVGESSVSQETSDDSFRNQPRASSGNQEIECSSQNDGIAHDEGRSLNTFSGTYKQYTS